MQEGWKCAHDMTPSIRLRAYESAAYLHIGRHCKKKMTTAVKEHAMISELHKSDAGVLMRGHQHPVV
jgi:hypothetical protein